VPKPAITGCSVSLLTVTLTWTAVSSPYPLTYKAVVAETDRRDTFGDLPDGHPDRDRRHPDDPDHRGADGHPRLDLGGVDQVVLLPLVGLARSCGAAS
jgi:hypothetical protein